MSCRASLRRWCWYLLWPVIVGVWLFQPKNFRFNFKKLNEEWNKNLIRIDFTHVVVCRSLSMELLLMMMMMILLKCWSRVFFLFLFLSYQGWPKTVHGPKPWSFLVFFLRLLFILHRDRFHLPHIIKIQITFFFCSLLDFELLTGWRCVFFLLLIPLFISDAQMCKRRWNKN